MTLLVSATETCYNALGFFQGLGARFWTWFHHSQKPQCASVRCSSSSFEGVVAHQSQKDTPLLSDKRSNEGWRTELPLLAIVSLAALLFGLHTLAYPFRRDHGEFAATAQVILDGGVPYRDVWNPKPPAVLCLWTVILTLAGPKMVVARCMDLLATVLAAVLLTGLGRRLWGSLGGVASGVSYAALYFANLPSDLAQNEGFMTVVVVISAVCFWRACNGGRSIWMAAAGLAGGVAVAFKYPIGLWLLFLGGWLLLDTGVGIRERLKRLSLVAIGALTVWVFLLGYLVAQQALGDFLESIRVTSGYTRLWGSSRLLLIVSGALVFYFVGQQFGATALAVGSLFVRPSAGERRSLYIFVLGWFGLTLAAICVQLKFYGYHWLPMLPALAILMGGGTLALRDLFARLLRRREAGDRQRVASWLAVGLIVAFLAARVFSLPIKVGYGYRWSAPDEQTYLARFGGAQDHYLTNVEVAHYVAAHSGPDDTLFIWGFEPVVYALSDRRPATRFIYSYPLVGKWYPAAWRQEVVDQLRSSPPAFVLVLENDALPTVTGMETDSATQLQDFPELLRLIEESYALDRQIGNFQVYRYQPNG